MTKRKQIVTEQDFWLDKPQVMGIRGYSLLIPAIASSIGFFSFGVLGFGFTELSALSDSFRQTLVLVGSFSLAFGSEVGTLSSITEIYRRGETLGKWDKIALVISILSTFGAFILAFASLLGVKATWGEVVQVYGPIALGLLSALDAYTGFMEFGLYLNTFDNRMKYYKMQFSEFKRATLQAQWERELVQNVQIVQSDNVQAVQENSVQVSKIERIGQSDDNLSYPIEQARVVKSDNKQERIKTMLDIYSDNPHMSITDMSKRLGVARSTIYGYLSELEQQGAIHNNGEGVQILEL